jgi:selenocysteine lyase/cysteine desulfurase
MVSAPDEMQPVPFGNVMRDTHFSFAKGYIPLNHGSYGATPICVQQYQQDLQHEAEARADRFLRKKLPKLLDNARAAIAPLLGAPVDEVVFVPNATTGVNTVLRNLDFQEGDVILYFSTIYDACEKTVQYICESTPAESLRVELRLPMSDTEILAAFDAAVSNPPKSGKRIKIALFDTVLTFPGVKMPWEKLVGRCSANKIFSLIDGAHSIGHIDLTHIGTISPDFFTSNCYKWLFTPRGSAIFYVPKRNHHLIRSSLPTSHGFKGADNETPDRFAELFAFVGTKEMSPFVCVPKALEFRKKVCGGEENIRRYCTQLAQQGGQRIADILGTRVMRSDCGTLQDCCFATIQLPLNFEKPDSEPQKQDGTPTYRVADWLKIAMFINEKAEEEHDTFIPVSYHAGYLWARISAQIYLDEDDFTFAGEVLKGLCHRVWNGEHESSA